MLRTHPYASRIVFNAVVASNGSDSARGASSAGTGGLPATRPPCRGDASRRALPEAEDTGRDRAERDTLYPIDRGGDIKQAR
jgi:hypothetical protein